MNLELLDPFGRQVPDRVDATIQLPDVLHYPPQIQSQRQSFTTTTGVTTGSTNTKQKTSKKGKKVTDDYDDDEDEEDEDEVENDDDLNGNLDDERVKRIRSKNQNSASRQKRLSSEQTHVGNRTSNNNNGTNYDDEDEEWKAAYRVSYNRRGNYLAVAYGSGTVAVFCTLTRTLSAIYYSDNGSHDNNSDDHSSSKRNLDGSTKSKVTGNSSSKSKNTKSSPTHRNNNTTTGFTSLSWARRSRRLLVGSSDDKCSVVKLYDTTHPIGSEDCATAAATIVAYGQQQSAAAAAAASYANSNADPEDIDNDSTTGEKESTRNAGKLSRESTPTFSRHIIPTMSSLSPALSANVVPPVHPYWKTATTPFANNDDDQIYTFARTPLSLTTKIVEAGELIEKSTLDHVGKKESSTVNSSTATASTKGSIRHPCVVFQFESPVVGSLHVHPRYPHAGISILSDGSLVLFWIPFHSTSPFVRNDNNTSNNNKHGDTTEIGIDSGSHHSKNNPKKQKMTIPVNDDDDGNNGIGISPLLNADVEVYPIYTKTIVACASFDSLGNRIYAATKTGTLIGFDISKFCRILFHNDDDNRHTQQQIPMLKPTFEIARTVGSSNRGADTVSSSITTSVWQLIVSRNGKFLIINSSDGTIRLYNTLDLWNAAITTTMMNDAEAIDTNHTNIKPTWTFQDVVTKVKFSSCDLSGDGEYVVGGANGADNKYELHIWNTSTGALMDKLTGASTKLYSVAWHPTRSFLAVACADGLVDVWGPRINWTAFAPDFQALPMNVEYVEREDEFDVDENGRHLAEGYYHHNEMMASAIESTKGIPPLNVCKIGRVPVFASDSEEEDDVFEFETRVKNLLVGRVFEAKNSSKKGVTDD